MLHTPLASPAPPHLPPDPTEQPPLPMKASRVPVRSILFLSLATMIPSDGLPQIGPSSPASRDVPPPGKLLHVSLGYTLLLPQGWTSQESEDGVMLLPAGVRYDPNRNDNPEAYIITVRNDYDPREEAQVVEQLSAAVTQSGGTGGKRESVTFGARRGAAYRWDFRDPTSGKPAALDILIAPEGNKVVLLMAAGERARVRAQEKTARQVLSSVTFVSPAAADPNQPLADNTPLAQRWLAKLRGKVVRQFWASQGMSSDKRHMLGSDGSYSYKSSSMVSVDAGGASGLSTGRDASTGRWRIRDISGQVYLEVRLNNGQVNRMRITQDNRNWYLNGEKAFAVDP